MDHHHHHHHDQISLRRQGNELMSENRYDEATECFEKVLSLCQEDSQDWVRARIDLLEAQFRCAAPPVYSQPGPDGFRTWRFTTGLRLKLDICSEYVLKLSELLSRATVPSLRANIYFDIYTYYQYAHRHRGLRLRVLREAWELGSACAGIELSLLLYRSSSSSSPRVTRADRREIEWILRQSLRNGKRTNGQNLLAFMLIQRIRQFGRRVCPIDEATIRLWSRLDNDTAK